MTVHDLCVWLQDTDFATQIRESALLFPAIETIHVIALTLVVGMIMRLDLRLLHVAMRDRPVAEVASEVLPWTWSGFVVAAIAGFLLFSSSAVKYYGNTPFRLKMVLLALAGANMLLFHLISGPSMAIWKAEMRPPLAARLAGGLSLLLWIGIVSCGRWIGFTMH